MAKELVGIEGKQTTKPVKKRAMYGFNREKTKPEVVK
jgi:hypothetical protein